MAITESKESREVTETTFGSTMRRIFNALWTDWDNVFDIFVGDLLGNSTLDGDFVSDVRGLRVTQAGTRYLNQTNCKIVVFYSTANTSDQQAIADQAGSWREEFDIGSDEDSTIIYHDFGSDEWQGRQVAEGNYKWNDTEGTYNIFRPSLFDSAGSIITDTIGNQEIPELLIRKGELRHRITAYSSTLYLDRILNRLNYVNGLNFISRYYNTAQVTGISHDVGILVNDIGKWLFVGCPIRRVGKNNWEYNFEFLYDNTGGRSDTTGGWNWQHGIRVNIYKGEPSPGFFSYDFLNLFVGMTRTDAQRGVAVGR